MNHVATIKLGTHDTKPYNILCVCGTGGDFGGKQEAMDWMYNMHFRTLGGVNTFEFQDTTPPDPVVEAPAEPAPAPAEVPAPPPADTPPATP